MQAVANVNAEQTERQARQERASAQFEAERLRLANKAKLSETRAALGGSGFRLDDRTSMTIIGQTVEQQTLSELLLLKQGEQRARNMEAGAAIERWEGGQRRKAANMQATVDLMKNGADWFNNYGSGITKAFTNPAGRTG